MSKTMTTNPSWATVVGRSVRYYSSRQQCKKENPNRNVILAYRVNDEVIVETSNHRTRLQMFGAKTDDAVRNLYKMTA